MFVPNDPNRARFIEFVRLIQIAMFAASFGLVMFGSSVWYGITICLIAFFIGAIEDSL